LRSKLKIRDVTEEYDTWSILDSPAGAEWNPEKIWKFGSGGAAEITWNMKGEESLARLGTGDGEIGSWDLRGGWGEGSMGKRFLVRKGDKREHTLCRRSGTAGYFVLKPTLLLLTASSSSDHDMADANAYLLRRMLNGVPEGHQEMIPNVSLPLESCMDVMGGGESDIAACL
jgi:hypothetical protein